jgi:hypothetical protein
MRRLVAVCVLCICGCAHGVVRISNGTPVSLPAPIIQARHAAPPTSELPRYAEHLPTCRGVFGSGVRYDDYQRCDRGRNLAGPWPSVFTVPEFMFLLDGSDHAELHLDHAQGSSSVGAVP